MGGTLNTQLKVLVGADLDIFENEIISIVGASGSGKSTLIHLLGGLDRPTEGEVFWNDEEISRLPDEKLSALRSRYVGFVFQFHHLLPEFSALENVMLPQMIARRSRNESEIRATELLSKVGIRDRINHKPTELSGGEQQRVAMARALANRPRVILADEPSGNLDSTNSQQLLDMIIELNRVEGQSFVIVTHNESYVECAHRSFRMHDGKLRREK